MVPIKASIPNITTVAFRLRKAAPLAKLLDEVRKWTESELTEVGFGGSVSWNLGNEHATVIGNEIVHLAQGVFNFNWLKNKSAFRTPNLQGFCRYLEAFCRPDGRLFDVRHCGFHKAYCNCKGERRQGWECESGAEFHSCDRTPFEASFYAYPEGPVMLTGWPVGADGRFDHQLYQLRKDAEQFGLLDKYHSDEEAVAHWRDDDWYLRLGAMRGIPGEILDQVVERMRERLREQLPITYPVMLADLSVVVYNDTLLNDLSIVHTIDEVIAHPELIGAIYSRAGYPA